MLPLGSLCATACTARMPSSKPRLSMGVERPRAEVNPGSSERICSSAGEPGIAATTMRSGRGMSVWLDASTAPIRLKAASSARNRVVIMDVNSPSVRDTGSRRSCSS